MHARRWWRCWARVSAAKRPWPVNLLKRQVKTPKLYIRDMGLLHQLLQIGNRDAFLCHPRLAA